MSNITFSAYARDDQGNAISGATVEAFVVGSGTPTASTTTDATGLYTLTVAANSYDIKITKGSQVRYFNAAVSFQATTIYGYDGVTAPLADASIKTSQLQDSSVTTAKLADANVTTAKIADANITNSKLAGGVVTADKISDGNVGDAAIGNRTIVDTVALADTGLLSACLGALGNQIKTITGEAGWKTAPADTVHSLDSRVTTLEGAYPSITHYTAANAGGGAIGGGATSTLATITTPTAGTYLVVASGTVSNASANSVTVTLSLVAGATQKTTGVASTDSSLNHDQNIAFSYILTVDGSTDLILKGSSNDAFHDVNYSAGAFQLNAIRIA